MISEWAAFEADSDGKTLWSDKEEPIDKRKKNLFKNIKD